MTTRSETVRRTRSRAGRQPFRWSRLLAPLVLVAATLVAAPGTASAADVPEKFVIAGSGYGHGVGMAQYGAYSMARRGAGASGILSHYYRDTAVANRTTPALIDVQVYGPDPYAFAGYGDTTSTTVTVHGGGWRLRSGSTTVAHGAAGEIKVVSRDGDVVVRAGDKVVRRDKLVLQLAGSPYFRPDHRAARATVKGAHGVYRYGQLILSSSEGVPNVVNRLRLNSQYLWGLSEMPASWGESGGMQALRAQAIVARSYALLKRGDWKRTCRCHVVDDVRDQNFTGAKQMRGAGSHWVRAVSSTDSAITKGKVLVHAGRPVEAHYFSSSGGRTANSEDVWSSRVAYERSEPDKSSLVAAGNDHASWRRAISQSAAQSLFGLKQVSSVKVTDRWASGQARTLVATAPGGKQATVTGKADEIRSRVGRSTTDGSVPSSWFRRITAG